ncbi:uncharacterized protein K460DRAFT_437679 [Cucurbitaria berberidis CBS 394.84]|uniref:Zn(2)-C6 fungal-type domain-containing protein n=1 Tax=Cucurbitaria berberidis CBS 394.84 TaxID=1168544 RepID=A0A9P4L3N7_9PLEO|nr:uncharacterized protein K460DRAFT_437679 [Cucurbitaria berberidis CBS 394.84]KAF1840514.1 hypothetical protein K460DRAFT_437679 [Cucurbitaria berberidis CBS 394.84]
MTPRNPSTTSTDTGPQRMSFATAEALLWGPELRKQHEWLLGEMRALQGQHEAYNARIQTTEAAAEAAEAATSRMRHMEQQIAAMGVVDTDKTFEKWATGEITRLRNFADRNQAVYQKQIELAKEVSVVADDFEKMKDVPISLKGLVRRLEHLESGRKQDAHQIKALEREIFSLKTMHQNSAISNISSRANINHRSISGKANRPPHVEDVEDLDTTETEDEGPVLPRRYIEERIQVPRSPEAGQNTSDTMFGTSPTRFQPAVSARLRLFKRPSIHNSKLPRVHEDGQHRAPAPRPEPHAPNPPATQLAHKASPRKRKYPDDEHYTQRMTRSQAKGQENDSKQPQLLGAVKITSTGASQVTSKSPIKRTKADVALAPSKPTPSKLTQVIASSPTKRKKPNVAPLQQPVGPQADNSSIYLPQNAADRVKTSPRRAAIISPSKAPIRLSCNACHRKKTKCDRARPFCGQCAKRSQRHACQYVQSPVDETQIVSTLPSSPSKKTIQANASVDLSRPGSARRVMPEITDYNTYLKMKADKSIL